MSLNSFISDNTFIIAIIIIAVFLIVKFIIIPRMNEEENIVNDNQSEQ